MTWSPYPQVASSAHLTSKTLLMPSVMGNHIGEPWWVEIRMPSVYTSAMGSPGGLAALKLVLNLTTRHESNWKIKTFPITLEAKGDSSVRTATDRISSASLV